MRVGNGGINGGDDDVVVDCATAGAIRVGGASVLFLGNFGFVPAAGSAAVDVLAAGVAGPLLVSADTKCLLRGTPHLKLHKWRQ